MLLKASRLSRSIAAIALLLPGLAAANDAVTDSDSLIDRGRYLALAGNCQTCHTQEGAAPYSGGVAFRTPLGVIYSSNISPDTETGIGKWSGDDLRRAMQEGVGPGGRHLFPAFPYTSFTKITDADVKALFAYLRTIKPVHWAPPSNGAVFRQRWGMSLWNKLFFNEGRYVPSAVKSEEWNRGKYLVEGLGHCGACHTPRNAFMAEQGDKLYQGGVIEEQVLKGRSRPWAAVDLTSSPRGLGAWKLNDLEKYLKTGVSARAGSFGPMNEVIVNSLSKLSPEDLHAMAVYLKDLPTHASSRPGVTGDEGKAGAAIYADHCEKCHSASGRGGMFSAPPVAGSAIVQSDNPASLINVILYGAQTPKGMKFGGWETMQPYADVLDDGQIAAVSNYLRGSWGNSAPAVSSADVARQR